MKILLISFTLGLISDGRAFMDVTGYSGEDAVIDFKYNPEFATDAKYFCKGLWPDCSNQIKAGAKNEWVTSGRFSVFDDTKSARFTAKIRNLTVEDSGTYQCGMDMIYGTDIYTKVELTIKKSESPVIFLPQKYVYTTASRVLYKTATPVPYFTFVPSQYAVSTLSKSSVSSTTEVQTPATGDSNIIVYVCVALLLGGIILIIVIAYNRCKPRDPETMAETSRAVNEDRGNGPIVVNVKLNQKNHAPESFYQNNNQSDSLYQSLDPNTNQSDSAYQSLNPKTNQSDSAYQTLNPKTNQSNSAYQSLNPQTNQSNSAYQTLNPKTNQSNSVYQSLNPQTNQSNSVYHTLNPKPNSQIQSSKI